MVAATPQICLELSHIYKCFGRQKVLIDFSLAIREREIVGIIGPNGAGKTTLFNITAGQIKPTKGRVQYQGQDITRWPPHRICRAGIGRTFQIARCFPEMTAFENVMMALWFGKSAPLPSSLCHEEAMELLGMVGLPDKATTKARELTLSELRRLEVARALGTRPQLLLLDEIAAGLSPQAVNQSVELVETLRERGLTLLITDHFLSLTVKVSDRLVALDQGEKIAEGPPYEVMRNPDVVSAYLGDRHKDEEAE